MKIRFTYVIVVCKIYFIPVNHLSAVSVPYHRYPIDFRIRCMYAETILHSGSLFSSLAFVLGSLNQKNTQEGRQIVLNCGLAFLQVFPQTQFSSSNCLPIIRRNCSSRKSSICFQSSSVVNPFLKSRNSVPLPSQKRGHWQSRSQGVNKALHIPAPAAAPASVTA